MTPSFLKQPFLMLELSQGVCGNVLQSVPSQGLPVRHCFAEMKCVELGGLGVSGVYTPSSVLTPSSLDFIDLGVFVLFSQLDLKLLRVVILYPLQWF